MQERWWSLPKAAARFGIPEYDLRCAIQTGDLVAMPSDDGETWLVRECDVALIERAPVRPIVRARGNSFPLFVGIALGLVVLLSILTVFIQTSNIDGGNSRPRATELMIKQISGQLEMYRLDHGRYPETLRDLVRRPDTVAQDSWPTGGYLTDESLLDGWGQEFLYRVPGTGVRPFDLISLGQDPNDPADDLWSRP